MGFWNVTYCRVEDKSMQFAYGIDMMFREILPRLAHGNDGLIFTALAAEYICGTDPHMYFLHYQTVLFLIVVLNGNQTTRTQSTSS